MGEYDHTMKVLVDADPLAIALVILRYGQRTRSVDVPLEGVRVIAQLSPEFPGNETRADGLLLMETVDGKQFLIHIEFQSTSDALMPDRLLDYCLRARRKHGPLPIISCVIYLREVGAIAEPPCLWPVFGDYNNMAFDYVCIKLWEVPREEILALNQPALLPLALLTKGEISRILIRETFEELLANKLYDLLPVGQTIASWLLQGTNLEWLKKEYRKMLDLFRDSPAYEWMTEDARAEGLAQGLEQGRKEAEQAREEAEKARKETMEVHQRSLETFQQTVVALVAERFPKLARLAQKQVRAVEEVERLQQLILRVSLTQDAAEIEELLLDLDEVENEP